MAEEYFDFDAAEWLESEEAIAEYMAAALETGDASFIKEALNDIVRARGMSGMLVIQAFLGGACTAHSAKKETLHWTAFCWS